MKTMDDLKKAMQIWSHWQNKKEKTQTLLKKGSIEIKLEAWLKSTSINKIIEKQEKAQFNNSEQYHRIEN